METNDKIRTMRKLNKLTQEEMAEKLEMSTGGYAKIERGNSKLNLERLEQIANVLNIDVSELMQDEKGLIIQVNDVNDGSHNQVSVYTNISASNAEIEQLKLIIQHKDELLNQKIQENEFLKEMIAVLKMQLNAQK